MSPKFSDFATLISGWWASQAEIWSRRLAGNTFDWSVNAHSSVTAKRSILTWLAIAALILAIGASAALVLKHVAGTELPGCGEGSPCDKVSKSAWGNISFLGISTASLGLAWFVGLLVWWIGEYVGTKARDLLGSRGGARVVQLGATPSASKRQAAGRGISGVTHSGAKALDFGGRGPVTDTKFVPSLVLVVVAAFGAIASLVFLSAMVSEKLFCKYCFAAHVGSLIFAACAFVLRQSGSRRKSQEMAPTMRIGGDGRIGGEMRVHRSGLEGKGAMIAAVAIAGMTFIGLWSAESRVRSAAKAEAEAKLRETIAKATSQTNSLPQSNPVSEPTREAADTPKEEVATQAAKQPDASKVAEVAKSLPDVKSGGGPVGLEGRYRLGPESAKVRILMWTDYQCPDCKLMEKQLDDVIAYVRERNLELNATIRHFPFSTYCNSNLTQDMHPDACFGAFAAEAMGELGGAGAGFTENADVNAAKSAAFWATHRWLFERSGNFTPELLGEFAKTLGIDGQAVVAKMEDEGIRARVKADIAQAVAFGLRQTPMVFVNGVELQGWNAPDALMRTVKAIEASGATLATAEVDKPASASERFIAEWRNETPVQMPDRYKRRWLGPANATIEVVVVGDYEEQGSAEVDGLLRLFTKETTGVPSIRYNFVHFPVNQACNPVVPFTKHANACNAAFFAEGADLAGGPEAFWKIHEVLMNNRLGLAHLSATLLAPEAGLELGVYQDALAQPWVREQVEGDANAAKPLNLASIPAVYVNGKLVRNWKVENENLLPKILEAAK